MDANCTALKSIFLPEGLTTLNAAFRGCSALESVTIPGSVSTIYGETFYDCSGLKTLIISEGVQTIGGYTLFGYSNEPKLEKVYLPRSLTSFEAYLFPYGNRNVRYYVYRGSDADTSLLDSGHSQQIVYLDDLEFGDCGTILMPDALNITAGGAFTLKPVFAPAGNYGPVWSSSNPYIATVKDGVVTAHNEGTATITVNVSGVTANALVTVTKIEGLMTLPASLTVIGREAFTGIKAKYVVVPATVTEIGANAFDNCPGGMSVEITSSSIDIDEDAFGDTSVVVVCPDGSPAMEFAVANGYTYKIK